MDHEPLRAVITVLVTLVEVAGVVVIVTGCAWAALRFVAEGARHRDARRFTGIRISLARFLALGLEFLLGADILLTAVSPSYEEIGKLAAIATIRTALNFFLGREVQEEQRAAAGSGGS